MANHAHGANGRFIRTAEHAERQRQAIELRTAGHTLAEIARSLGFASPESARRAISKGLREVIRPAAEELAEIELSRLESYTRRLVGIVLDPPPVVAASGKLVLGEDGRPVPDQAVVVQAIRELRQLSESRRRLVGLDAPTKRAVEVRDVSDERLDAEIVRLARELGLGVPGEPGSEAYADWLRKPLALPPAP